MEIINIQYNMKEKIEQIFKQIYLYNITLHEAQKQVLDLFSVSQLREQLAILALERISKAHSESFSADVASEALYKIANCG